MKLIGIGTDIIEIKRIDAAIEKHGMRFLNKLFTADERNYCSKYGHHSARHYAARFAAKEAVVKAIGTGFNKNISWQDIEIIKDNNGKPEVKLSSKLQNIFNGYELMVSISHCHNYATASVICYQKE